MLKAFIGGVYDVLICKEPLYDLVLCVLTRRERSKVPLIVRQCVEEIERRGMDEVGIYRVSGVATDIQALKAAFDSSEFSLNLIFFLKIFDKQSCERRDTFHVNKAEDRALNDRLMLYSQVFFEVIVQLLLVNDFCLFRRQQGRVCHDEGDGR